MSSDTTAMDELKVTVIDKKANELPSQPLVSKKGNQYSYWQLYRYADRTSIAYMAIGTISGLINGSIAPLLNLLIGEIANLVTDYDKNPSPENRDTLYSKFVQRLIYLAGLAVGSFVFGFLQTFCWSIAAEKQTKIIREHYFASVIKQDLTWFSLHPSGELTSRISSDVNQMYNGMAEKVGYIIQFTTSCIVGLTLAGVTSWRLTVILIGVFPIPAIALNRMWHQVGINLERVQDSYSRAGALAIQAFRSISTVMINNGQSIEDERYSSLLEGVRRVGKRIALINGAGVGIVSFFFMAVRTPVFYYGGVLVLGNQLTTGDAIATFLQISSGVMFLSNILTYVQSTNEAQGAAQKVFQIIETEPKLDISSNEGLKPEDAQGKIELKDVCFAYPSRPDVPILNHFSLTIDAGKNVALVGPSGGGKSTVFQLIMRIYDPNSGSVLFDDKNVKDLNLLWLRNNLSIVSQEPVLFDKTIAENILLGASSLSPPPTRDDIKSACAAANAVEFIKRFAEGLDTRVMRGTSLSGGQKQRVAIARAVIRNPRVLMLDEATSALDTKSERMVQSAIDKLAKHQTTIMIAHRLSTVINADMIVVIDGGAVIESGNHNQLMELKGFYHSMIMAQEFGNDAASGECDTPEQSSFGEGSPNSATFSASEHILSVEEDNTKLVTLTRGIKEKNDVVLDERVKLSKLAFPFRRIFEISKPDMKYLFIGLSGSIFDGTLVPLEAFLMGINLAIYGNTEKFNGIQGVTLYSLLFLPLGLLAFLGKGLQQYGFGISGSNLTERLRVKTFSKLIRQDMYFFDKELNSSGALASALSTDADAIKKISGPLAGQIFTAGITLFLGFSIAFAYGWQLTLLMVACAPLLFLATFLERKALEGFTEQTKRAYEASGQLASTVLINIKTVMMLSKEHEFSIEYHKSLVEPHRIGIKKSAVQAVGSGLFQALLIIVFLIAFLFCYYLISNKILAFENIIIVILNVILTSVAVGTIAAQARNLTDGKIGANAIFKVLDTPCKIDVDSHFGRTEKPAMAEVEFKNVRFAFPARSDVEVLKGISISIGRGEKVALVGSSGSGKSTIASLLQRLYDPVEGQIYIDGTEIRDWNLSHYRSQIGVVGQEPVLFDLTIEQNILYGYNNCPVISKDDTVPHSSRQSKTNVNTHSSPLQPSDELRQLVIEAAKMANIHDFILGLPDGYNTRVGEMGSSLSGGQKQRVAIARALIRNPSLLILDEATSALDSETENLVEDALLKASHKCTTLVIAHRLKLIQNADKIYVLQDGQVIEFGNHHELLAMNGIYASMVQQQSLSMPM